MPGPQAFDSASELFRLLSDGSRLQVFWLLCHCEECVANLATLTGLTSPALCHHLKILKNAGLVVTRREGREVHYTASDTPRAKTLHKMIEDMVELSCPAGHTGAEPDAGSREDRGFVKYVTEVRDFLTANPDKRFTLDELSQRFHVNPTTLEEHFRIVYGMPIAAYMREYRMKQAMEMLRTTDEPVSAIARKTGYGTQSNFTQAFKTAAGLLPTEYRSLYNTVNTQALKKEATKS